MQRNSAELGLASRPPPGIRPTTHRRALPNYISFIRDKTMHQATKQALEATAGYKYVLISDTDAAGRDIEQMVLQHHDDHVAVATVRKWHAQLISAVEDIAQTFANNLQK